MMVTLIKAMLALGIAQASVEPVEKKYQELMADPQRKAVESSENIFGATPETSLVTQETKNAEVPAEALTYKDLYRDNITIQQKWDILSDLSQKSPAFAKEVYLSCLESTDWLLRVGGLKFLANMDEQTTIEKARELILKDKALVVRSAAVDVLVELGSVQRAKAALWEALEDTKNFHKGQSLWIRQNIANALKSFSHKVENKQWIKYLDDNDVMVQKAAVEALEKNNDIILGRMETPLKEKSELWRLHLTEQMQPAAAPGELQNRLMQNATGVQSESQDVVPTEKKTKTL